QSRADADARGPRSVGTVRNPWNWRIGPRERPGKRGSAPEGAVRPVTETLAGRALPRVPLQEGAKFAVDLGILDVVLPEPREARAAFVSAGPDLVAAGRLADKA